MKFIMQILLVAATMFGLVELAQAASHLPPTTAATLTTDVTDTYNDTMSWVWGIFPVIALGWFAFNQARKGAGKFGAK